LLTSEEKYQCKKIPVQKRWKNRSTLWNTQINKLIFREGKYVRGKGQPELYSTNKIRTSVSMFKDKKSNTERSSNTSPRKITAMVWLQKRISVYETKNMLRIFWKLIKVRRRELKSCNRKNCRFKRRLGKISYNSKHKKYQKIIKNIITLYYSEAKKSDAS
jgi:hypothetical protein